MALSVNKWQANRPRWNYSPTMQMYFRIIQVAQMEAMEIGPDGTPTDEALLARDWFAASELESEYQADCQYVSFPKACEALGLNLDAERVAFVKLIDDHAEAIGMDFDTDECWARLEYLKSRPLADDEEPVFALPDWARVVPAVDQAGLWAVDGAAPAKKKREKSAIPHPVARAVPQVAQLGFVM